MGVVGAAAVGVEGCTAGAAPWEALSMVVDGAALCIAGVWVDAEGAVDVY